MIAIIILSIVLLGMIILIGMLISKLDDSHSQLRLVQSEADKSKNIENKTYYFLPGGRALIMEYGLLSEETSFKVTYEVNIVEESKLKIKVRAYDFISDDDVGKDPQYRKNIISFMQDRWVDKSQCEPILDDEQKREVKLNQLLQK